MDVDEQDEQVEIIELFDLEPHKFPWRAPVHQQVEDRRVEMSDLLIFDILLASGGVRHPDSIYPPTDGQSLQRLLDAIDNTTYDELKKDCLIYFLLKWHQDGREDNFVVHRCIPPQFVALADAYWYLDTGLDIARGVSLLSDVRLNREHTTKILQALSLDDDPHTLIKKYLLTAKPLLTEPVDIDAFVVALAESSLLEAWSYQRSFSETSETRERVFKKLLDWCFVPKPRATALKHLLAFPLSPYEERLLQSYATDLPASLPSSSIPVLHDLVCLRLVQGGRFAAAVKLERRLSARNTPRISEQFQKATHERRQMMDDIMAAMPIAERQLLELELEQLARGKGTGMPSLSASWSSKMKNSAELSMSWESIRASPTGNGAPPAASVSAAAGRAPGPFADSSSSAIPQRSGAPRFGGPMPAVSSVRGQQDLFTPLVFPTGSPQVPLSAASTSAAAGVFEPRLSASGRGAAPPLTGTSAFHISPISRVAQSTARPSTTGARIGSLFETVGSANSMPNAFYQPPVSAGTKRPFGQDSARTPTSAFRPPPTEQVDDPSMDHVEDTLDGDDVEMQGDDEPVANGHVEAASASASVDETQYETHGENGVSAEFSVSVFSPPPPSSQNKQRAAKATAATPKFKTVPGAFGADSDEDSEPASPPMRRTRRTPAPRPSPSPPPVRRAPRTLRTATEQDLGRSLPGTLVDDDEEEDDVPPLPPATPAARRGRKSKAQGSSQDRMTEAELTQPRRSTRLSTAPSVDGSSPEPVSPQKTRVRSSKRKSTAAPTKNSSRRKR